MQFSNKFFIQNNVHKFFIYCTLQVKLAVQVLFLLTLNFYYVFTPEALIPRQFLALPKIRLHSCLSSVSLMPAPILLVLGG